MCESVSIIRVPTFGVNYEALGTSTKYHLTILNSYLKYVSPAVMEYSLPVRPHTVSAMSKPYIYSDRIMKILEEIESDATMSPSKPPVLQKNHLKENFKRLKDIQEKAKQKAAEKQPLKPIRAFNKYSQVQPKVSAQFNAFADREKLHGKQTPVNGIPRTAGPYRSQAPLSPCLSAKSEGHHSLQQYKSLPMLNQAKEEDKMSQYSGNERKKDERDLLYQKSPHDLPCVKTKQKGATKADLKHRLGHIPSYLTERKKQWELERERQLKLLEEASIPPGHTLLPDEERLETLELLKKNQDELLQCLASLPVRNDTVRLQHYKEDLERQLAKVEEGIKIFSRPKVLIKNDI